LVESTILDLLFLAKTTGHSPKSSAATTAKAMPLVSIGHHFIDLP
jgi:hypothetical protein